MERKNVGSNFIREIVSVGFQRIDLTGRSDRPYAGEEGPRALYEERTLV